MTDSALPQPVTADRIVTVQETLRRRYRLTRWALVSPALLVIGIFGVLPLVIILVYSFLVAGSYGGVEWKFSTEAYVSFLFERDIFDGTLQLTTDYLGIFLRSILLAGATT